MYGERRKDDTARIRAVTRLSIAANLSLSAVKLVVGILTGSLALMADGIHSLSDIVTDVAVLVGLHLGSREPDECHPYGHGRLETLSAGAVAIVLVVAGSAMIYKATLAIAGNVRTLPHIGVLVTAVFSIGAKEWLYRVTKRAAVESHSSALYANAWHHRSDALSSVAVVAGYTALAIDFAHGDAVAAIAVGLMIIWVGVKIISKILGELAERAVDPEMMERIKAIIDSEPDIRSWHKLRTRMVGREVFLDLHILVDPALNVAGAHEIAERLEESLSTRISRPTNIIVHVEPDVPELRK